ncbi:DUF4374 domain-containing protein [Wenyingzhuangia sp. IMCC45467]
MSKSMIFGVLLGIFATATSCSSDDNTGTDNSGTGDTQFFISAAGEESEYILTTNSLEEGSTSISGNGIELEMTGYTWLFDDSPSTAIGLVYNQGDPGVGLGYQLDANGLLQKQGEFQISSRFTNYGFFDHYAITSVSGQTPVDENGNALTHTDGSERQDGTTFNFIDLNNGLSLEEKTITTLNIAGNGEQASLSGIVDMGNGEFLSALVLSQAQDEEATGGASTGTVNYPNNVWVAAFDENLNVVRIYEDDRISYASGRYRSRYYSMIAPDDNGNAYVFSGSYDSNTTLPCGALRINGGADDFDQNYYFNIEALTGGYRFQQVFHITGDYYLLRFYNEVEVSSSSDPATQYGVVNMTAKTFSWLSGDFPEKENIVSIGLPYAHGGKMYLPITATGEYPTIYNINPTTAVASKGLVVQSTDVRAIGVLTK